MRRFLLPTIGIATTAIVAITGYSAIPQQHRLAVYATSLLGRNFSQRHNAHLSADRINGTLIPVYGEFSFNQRVGSYSSDRGYRKAPVSYNGQLIDDWGGGVCQTSTTLYNAALLAGMQIEERHPHQFCPSYIPPGRDAAVAYSSVDLRFKNPYSFPVRIHATTESDLVSVEFVAPQGLPKPIEVVNKIADETQPATFYTGIYSHSARVRNSGKPGYEVAVYRITGNNRELVSQDDYPVMNRLVEYR